MLYPAYHLLATMLLGLSADGFVPDVDLQIDGNGNLGLSNWPAGTWQVRAVLVNQDGDFQTGLSTELTYNNQFGTICPAFVSVQTNFIQPQLGWSIRVYRLNGAPILPATPNVDYATYSCNDAGNLAAYCQSGTQFPLPGDGVLHNPAFTGRDDVLNNTVFRSSFQEFEP
jgi:hypothetical protein